MWKGATGISPEEPSTALGLDHPRKRACLTAIHNFFLTRPDGTAAAERFFGQETSVDVCRDFGSRRQPAGPLSPPQRAVA